MTKSKKIVSAALALIIALSTLIVGASAVTASAVALPKVTLQSTSYNTNATVTLGWTSASGVSGYQIAKKRITDKAYTYLETNAFKNSYNDKNVVCGTIYYYQVRTFTVSSKGRTYGAWSNSKSITTLYRPTITSLNYINNNKLNINWNKILGVSHYRLAFKRTTDKAWNYRDVKTTYYNIPNPTKGATYTIQVCPMNGKLAGQWSLVKSLQIGVVLPKVNIYGVGYSPEESTAFVKWTYPANYKPGEGFILYYKSASDKNWSSVDVKSNSTNVSVRQGETYYFQLRYYKDGAYGPYSDVKACYMNYPDEDYIVSDFMFGDEDNITLKVWAPDRAVSLVKQQVENFKKYYPSKKFKSIDVVAQGEGNAGTMLLNDMANAADVLGFTSDMLGVMADEGVISPAYFAEEITSANTEASVKSATVDDIIYAYPETNDNTYLLVYDKSVVSAEQAKTLEGVLQACKAKDEKFIYDCSDGFYACAFAFTGGVKTDGYEYDGYTQKFTDYNEDEAVATLQAFSGLMHDYSGTFVSTDVAKISTGFSNKTVGAGVDGMWNINVDKAALGSRFGAAKLPTIKVNGQNKQMVPMVGYKLLGVNSASRFPNSAQILAYYLSSKKCQKERAEQLGWAPTNNDVIDSTVVKNNPVLTAIAQQEKSSVAQTNISPTFWAPMGNLGNKLYSYNTNPEDKEYFGDLLDNTIYYIKDY